MPVRNNKDPIAEADLLLRLAGLLLRNVEPGAEILNFLFKRSDAGEERSLLQLFEGPALRDVLWAVPVEGGEMDGDEALGAGCGFDLQFTLPFGRFAPRRDFDGAEDLEAGLVWLVHKEERGAVVAAQVAGGDVLTVTGDVGEGESAAVAD